MQHATDQPNNHEILLSREALRRRIEANPLLGEHYRRKVIVGRAVHYMGQSLMTQGQSDRRIQATQQENHEYALARHEEANTEPSQYAGIAPHNVQVVAERTMPSTDIMPPSVVVSAQDLVERAFGGSDA